MVCGIGPSAASTSRRQPSAMDRTRSTSPPKSAWPGVSIRLICRPLRRSTERLGQDGDAAFAFESVELIAPGHAGRRGRSPLCRSKPSTSVVLPWSTWAMIAMLRSSMGRGFRSDEGRAGGPGRRALRP